MNNEVMTLVFLAMLLLCLGFGILFYLISSQKKQDTVPLGQGAESPNPNAVGKLSATVEGQTGKCSLEFSKIMLLVILGMWVLGGFLGFWVVIFRDASMLMDILDYIHTPVLAGVGVYGAKSGAENWKKLSQQQSTAEDSSTAQVSGEESGKESVG